MTDEIKPTKLEALKEAAPDLVGVLGLALLTRGLWAWMGEPLALTVCGFLLIVLSVVSILRGGR
jgi:CBS-domain-containing membrane protein